MLRKEQVFFHAFSGDLFTPLCLISRAPAPGRSEGWVMVEREGHKPYTRNVFVGANMLNKSACRRIKPQLTQQRQKLVAISNCWHSCIMLCPKAERWWERILSLPFLYYNQFH